MSAPLSFLWAHISALCCVTDERHAEEVTTTTTATRATATTRRTATATRATATTTATRTTLLAEESGSFYECDDGGDDCSNGSSGQSNNPQDPLLQSTTVASSSSRSTTSTSASASSSKASSSSASASAAAATSTNPPRGSSGSCGRRRLLTTLEVSSNSSNNNNSNSSNSNSNNSSNNSRHQSNGQKSPVGEADRGGGLPSEKPEELLSLQIQLPLNQVYHISASYSATPNSLMQEVESISGIPAERQVWTCLPGCGPYPEFLIGEGVTFGRLFIESFGKAPLILRVEDESHRASTSSSSSSTPMRRLSSHSGVELTGGSGGGSNSNHTSSNNNNNNTSNDVNDNGNVSSGSGSRRRNSSTSSSSSSSSAGSASSSTSTNTPNRSRKSNNLMKRSNSKLESPFPAIQEEEHEHRHDDSSEGGDEENTYRSRDSTDRACGHSEASNNSNNNNNNNNNSAINNTAANDDESDEDDDYDGTNGLPTQLKPSTSKTKNCHNTVKSSFTLPAAGKYGESRLDGEGSRGTRQNSKNSNGGTSSNGCNSRGTNGGRDEDSITDSTEMVRVNTWGGTSSVGDLVAGLEALNEYMTWEQDHQSDLDQGAIWQQEVLKAQALQKQGGSSYEQQQLLQQQQQQQQQEQQEHQQGRPEGDVGSRPPRKDGDQGSLAGDDQSHDIAVTVAVADADQSGRDNGNNDDNSNNNNTSGNHIDSDNSDNFTTINSDDSDDDSNNGVDSNNTNGNKSTTSSIGDQQHQQQQQTQKQQQPQRQQQHLSQDRLPNLHPSILASADHHHQHHTNHNHHPTLVLEDNFATSSAVGLKHRHTVTAAATARHGHSGSTSTTGSLWTSERVRKSEANLAEMAKGGSAMEIVSLLASPALMGARDADSTPNGTTQGSCSFSSLDAIAKLHGHSSKFSKKVEMKESVLSEDSSDLEEQPPTPGNLWKRRGGVSAEASGEYNQNFVDWTPQIFEKSLEDAEDILEALRNFPPLSRVSVHVIKALAATVEIVEYSDGDCICTQGEVGCSGYVILEGDIDVFVEEGLLATKSIRELSDETSQKVGKGDFKRTMTRGRFFGEHTMLWGFHRGANIFARGRCRLGIVNRNTYFNLAPRYEMEKRLNREALLRKARVFETLDDDQLAKLVDVMVCLRFAPGEEIIRQGERGQEYFIILEGECLAEVLVGEQALDQGSLAEAREAGALQEHARYFAGDAFGERGFTSGEARGATVTAVTPVAVLSLKRSQFRRLLGDLKNLQAKHYVHDPRMTIAEFYKPGDERGPRGVVRRVRAATGSGSEGEEEEANEENAEEEGDDDEAEDEDEDEEEQEEEPGSLPAEPSSPSSGPRPKKTPKSKTVTEWFAVYRPTSRDAIAKMLSKKAVGKGLNVKGKSSKKAHLSGYVPFLQIHTDEHKHLIEESPPDTRVTVFYQTTEGREAALWSLLPLTLPEAKLGLLGDPSIKCIDDYPKVFGLEMHERVLREAYIERQTINFLVGWDTGRESVPSFQDMNLHSIRGSSGPRVVLFQFDAQNAMNPHGLLMAYAEDKVKPVVSDFDTFTVGSRNMNYHDPLPREQWELALRSLNSTAGILEDHSGKVSWTDHWIEVLRQQKQQGEEHAYSMPPYGFGDPLSQRLIKEVVAASKETGAIRHGAECFNFTFPQELDYSYLVVWQGFREKGLPWHYYNEAELRQFLLDRVTEGYIFPLNAVWVVRDQGWYDVFQALKSSPASESAFKTWYPPESRLLETIEEIHAKFPKGFSFTPQRGEAVHRLNSMGSNSGETFQFQKGWQSVMQELCNAKGRTESLLQTRAAVLQGLAAEGLDADEDEKGSRQDQMQRTLTKLESEYFECKLGVDDDDDEDMNALERADLELFEVQTDFRKVESLANATRVISRMKHLLRSRQKRAYREASKPTNARISIQSMPNEWKRLAAQCTLTEDGSEGGRLIESDEEKD